MHIVVSFIPVYFSVKSYKEFHPSIKKVYVAPLLNVKEPPPSTAGETVRRGGTVCRGGTSGRSLKFEKIILKNIKYANKNIKSHSRGFMAAIFRYKTF